MTTLEAIRKRHQQEEEQRQVCPCSLCQKHVDRGELLAMVDDLGLVAQLEATAERRASGEPVAFRPYEEYLEERCAKQGLTIAEFRAKYADRLPPPFEDK